MTHINVHIVEKNFIKEFYKIISVYKETKINKLKKIIDNNINPYFDLIIIFVSLKNKLARYELYNKKW